MPERAFQPAVMPVVTEAAPAVRGPFQPRFRFRLEELLGAAGQGLDLEGFEGTAVRGGRERVRVPGVQVRGRAGFPYADGPLLLPLLGRVDGFLRGVIALVALIVEQVVTVLVVAWLLGVAVVSILAVVTVLAGGACPVPASGLLASLTVGFVAFSFAGTVITLGVI